MASDLDKKLKEILYVVSAFSSDHGHPANEGKLLPAAQNVEEALVQIKQAFVDAGYVDASKMLQVADLLTQQAGILKDMAHANLPPIYGTGLMTGQEWYDRFKQEFVADKGVSYNGDLLAVARRAAGIE